MYLIDTNVISELRKSASNKADENVINWANTVSAEQLYLSVITILELERGILMMERSDPIQGSHLRSWFDKQVLPTFSERTLPIDTAVAQRCAKLHVPNPKSDRDALIAATAIAHSMIVVTRNVKDFLPTGVEVINPWEIY